MVDKREAEQIIAECLDSYRLKRIIRNTSIVAWQKEISEDKIDEWLKNFDGSYFENVENEKKLALWLLAHFSYYTMEDVRILCKKLYDQYMHEKLCSSTGTDLSKDINDIIKNTLFVGLGNDSESGNNILYYFRQENNLCKDNFEIDTNKTYENLVYVDDVTISGEQALKYIQSRKINAKNTYVAVMIATDDAINNLNKSRKKVKPIATMILDQRDKAFSDAAYVFSDKRIREIRKIAQEFCELYGKKAVKGCGYMVTHPLGFDDGQYMISFEYNTPDNTLPIFWGTGSGWNPLFKRYPKIYKGEEYVLDDRKYY